MAFGSALGQKPSVSKYSAITAEYPVATGYSVNLGDVVDIDRGQVTKGVTPNANTEIVVTDVVIQGSSLVNLNNQYSVAVFRFSDQIRGYLIDNETGQVAGNSDGYMLLGFRADVICTRLNDNQFLLAYIRDEDSGYDATIVALTGTSLSTVGSATLGGQGNASSFVQLSDNRVFYTYTQFGTVYGKVLTVSGTSVTITDGTIFSEGLGNSTAALLPDDASGNKRICICGMDGATGKAVVATINSSNAISFGGAVTFESSNLNMAYSVQCSAKNNLIVAAYNLSTNVGYVIPLTANGSTLSVGTKVQLSTNVYYKTINTVSDAFLVSYNLGGANGYAVVVSENNGALTIGDPFQFHSSGISFLSSSNTSNNKVALAYQNGAVSNFGTITTLEVNGDQVGGSFVTSSTDAIALESGSSGDTIEVILAGTVEAPWITQGQEITSPGVYGFGALDGLLNVRPYWDVPSTGGAMSN